MKILMIGGTGTISAATTRRLIESGEELYLLNRGTRAGVNTEGATVLRGDMTDEDAIRDLIAPHEFDVVVDWIAFTPDQIERDVRLFAGKTAQYIYISSASVYQRPAQNYLVTEDTPLENPFWEYSRNKIACEKLAMQAHVKGDLPVTIVRPSLTYGDRRIPYCMTSGTRSWSLVDRLERGKRVIVPGDGSSLWVITHNSDFAKGITGLMGQDKALGEAFHITSDEVLTWDQIAIQIAEAVGVEPKLVHISSEFISAFRPDAVGNLTGDKSTSVVFDNSKLRSVVPDFKATVSFREGMARTVAYMRANPELQVVETEFEELADRIIAAHDHGMAMASRG